MIAVPTTAGSGSEVSRGALITTKRGDVIRKTLIAHYRLVPSAAIVDPSLTYRCPMRIAYGCAMDILTHLIEELSSPVSTRSYRASPLKRSLAWRSTSPSSRITSRARTCGRSSRSPP